MKAKAPAKLRPGERIFNGSLKGVVMENQVDRIAIAWDCTGIVDVVGVHSPLWLFLEVVG